MTTDATTVEEHLAKLGIDLPATPTAFATDVDAIQTGNQLFLSAMLVIASTWETPILN